VAASGVPAPATLSDGVVVPADASDGVLVLSEKSDRVVPPDGVLVLFEESDPVVPSDGVLVLSIVPIPAPDVEPNGTGVPTVVPKPALNVLSVGDGVVLSSGTSVGFSFATVSPSTVFFVPQPLSHSAVWDAVLPSVCRWLQLHHHLPHTFCKNDLSFVSRLLQKNLPRTCPT
jgi:hypothetical protein